jgi:hypothetical protein
MAIRLELHDRVDEKRCARCGGNYRRVYGTIWDDERRAGVYSADLHQRHDDARVVLAVGTMGWDATTEQWRRYGVTLEIWPTVDEIQMKLSEASQSPFANSDTLGHILGRAEALASPLRDEFFHLADHIVREDARVRDQLNQYPMSS